MDSIQFYFRSSKPLKHSKGRILDIITTYHKQRKLLSFFVKNLCKELREKKQYGKYSAYYMVLKDLFKFVGSDSIELKQLTVSLIDKYEKYLYSKKKDLNIISFYMRNIYMIYKRIVTESGQKSIFSKSIHCDYIGIQATKKSPFTQQEIGLYEQRKSLLPENANYIISTEGDLYGQSPIVTNKKKSIAFTHEDSNHRYSKRKAICFSSLESVLH